MRKILLLMFFCSLADFFTCVYAQTTVRTIKGTVKDSDGQTLSGATIIEVGVNSNGTTANADGQFVLRLKGTSGKITISLIGYTIVERTVPPSNEVAIILPAQAHALQEVVIGYTTQKRRNVTAAISSIKGADIANQPESSFDQLLQGRLPGVSVLSSSGELGQKPSIVIRGSSNVDYANANGGNSGPLYVIDGIIYDVNAIGTSYGNNDPLSFINPQDIESIDVLKDASAAAIYGARGGNGVIIVKTKSASRGKPQVNFNAFVGYSSHPNFLDVVTGQAERNLKLQIIQQGLPYLYKQQGSIPLSLTDSLNRAFNNNVDWQGLLIRSSSITNSQDLSVAGITGTTQYRLSLNHYNEQGVINGYELEKITPHLTLSVHPVNKLNLSVDILMAQQKQSHGAGGLGDNLFASWGFPTSNVQLNDAQVNAYSGKKQYYDDDKALTFVGSIAATDTLSKRLTLHSTYAMSTYNNDYNYFSPQVLNGTLNTAYDIHNNNPSWSWENFVQYDQLIKKNHLNFVLGGSLYSNQQYYSYISAAGINVSGIYTAATVPSGTNLNAYSSYQQKNTASYYGRFNYDYDGKYLFMASVRRDASSIYSSQYRWGTFPSVSAGWIISDESFFEPIKSVANFAKIRVSYGITGLDPGGWYVKDQALQNDASYFASTTGSIYSSTGLGGIPSTYNGTSVITPYFYNNFVQNGGVKSSSDVRWERDPQLDIGADIELFRSRVNLTFDYYNKHNNNIFFYNVPAQATSGYQYYSGNYVSLRNAGWEAATNINVLGPKSNFKWMLNLNVSFNSNVVTQLPNNNRDFLFGPAWFYKTLTVGRPIFSYRVYKTNGVYPTDASVPTDPVTGQKETFNGATLHGGDPRYVDVNGDYNITNDDKVNAGDPNPKYTGGFGSNFSFKGFSLGFFCSYVFGRTIINGALSDELNGSTTFNNYTGWNGVAGPAAYPNILSQFWQTPGQNAKYARLIYPTGTGMDPWNVGTDYFLRSGNFVKLRNVTLGYELPKTWLNNTGIKRLNVYVMGQNLWMWKAAKDIPDPELVDPTTGSSNTVYPTVAKFTLGASLTL
ncbi:SusC/RagA family TonB-linked outer membrane protein [Mucilaginibacter sp. KACC 22063]|uniref:SusC/RagA family TonB-linked outer membrane protein n=1 Tax=Mucilaginibacter sp. KACC 22063 TaxID=3025666 RepID=UPI00236645D3|nr:SusC/RagA family TonB-linked outer membrane protein [Mucilaginibacter sp. KACC 22063]WDF55855.1 SusC/RagA family TonB-linked outer membrane protein [Mucilaginibacter sp. KACC 22063]